jgi:hypothetical protein
MEAEIPPPAILFLRQGAIQNSEQLRDSFLSAAMASSWVLNGERVHHPVMAAYP